MSSPAKQPIAHAHSPFIIWTLQRTGGTNLTQRLVERSGLSATQHEPFNLGRVYGDITQHWMDTNDEAALTKSMREIAARRGIIKHCVEMVPWELTRALADATIQSGYRHLFLYRVNALDRLLSLHFAEKTGVWGPNMKKEVSPELILEAALPQARLIKHEEKCVGRLTQTWAFLLSQGCTPEALSYEELYRATTEQAACKLLPVLTALGLSRGNEDDQGFIKEVIGKGDQGTRDKYAAMPGVRELEEALRVVPAFVPEHLSGSGIKVSRADFPPWVTHAQIDVLPSSLLEGQQFEIGGVVVLGPGAPEGVALHLLAGENRLGINWGIASPKMAKRFPATPHSARARFISDVIQFTKQHKIAVRLVDGQSNQFPLFDITLS